LLDRPNSRKIHDTPTPFTGGIILSLSFIFITSFLLNESTDIQIIIFYSFWISLLILIDDIFILSAFYKFIIQLFCVLILINKKIYITDIGYYDFFGLISLGNYNIIFTILCLLLLINAVNYNDGIDGLAGSIAIVIFSNYILVILLFAANAIFLINYFLLFITSTILFLCFNFGILAKFKLFLGDSGSNYLGLIIGAFTIILSHKFNVHPTLLIWPLAYTIFEFLITNIIRIAKFKNIFEPGADHLHYYLMTNFKLGSKMVLIIILSVNLLFSFLGIVFYYKFGSSVSITLFPLFFIIYSILRYKIIRL
jgi:UDP-GlcNAc:undecaprenyl-phosphate GlcNAc-1-phosphate transferase